MTEFLNEARLERAARLLWGLVLVCLPITSFRYFPGLFGASTVRPLALYPLALLLVVLLLQVWQKRSLRLPAQAVALTAFLIAAAIATLIALFYTPLPLRGETYLNQVVRDWAALALGLAFFFGALWAIRDEDHLQASLPWLYAGLAASILWGGLQAVALNTDLLERGLMSDLQRLFSIRPLNARRVSGFAYEPAWLADQITLLYLPWLLAALVTGRRATRWRWLEWLLLTGAVALLLLTYSRSGILSALIVSLLVLLLTGGHSLRRAWGWFRAPFGQKQTAAIFFRTGLVLALVLGVAGAGYWLSSYRYFSSLWGGLSLDIELSTYLLRINAGPRGAAALAGLEIFGRHPWTGVGLGGSGLYLYDHFPDWIYNASAEVSRQLSPDSNLIPNIKNLYVRLLAETGLLGFWLWIAFLLSILGRVRQLLQAAPGSAARFVGVAGLFIWLTAALRNVTQDSLTFPLMWVGFGIILGFELQATIPLLLGASPWTNEKDS
jgi:hypothetical protein